MKTTTRERDPQAAARLQELIADIAVAMVTTVTPDGALHSQPMLTLDASDEGELWFLTSAHSRMSGDIAEEHAVNVSYAEPERDHYVSVSAQASIVDDRDRVRELWRSGLERFFPRGAEDPRIRLLRVRVESAEYWESAESRMQPLAATSEVPDGREQPDGGSPASGSGHTKVENRATRATG